METRTLPGTPVFTNTYTDKAQAEYALSYFRKCGFTTVLRTLRMGMSGNQAYKVDCYGS